MKDKITYKSNNETLCIVASKKDIASMTIAKELEMLGIKIFYLEKHFLYCEDKDLPEADIYIFLSRHSSATGTPAFTVHSIGNFSPEEPKLGGKSATLVKTNAQLSAKLLKAIDKLEKEEPYDKFEVTPEITHHGPYLSNQAIFIEMGSDSNVWNDPKAGKILATAIKNVLEGPIQEQNLPCAISFGGNHYSSKFREKILTNEFIIGHMCPKYAVDYLTKDLVDQMVTKTFPKPQFGLFDKKSMKRKAEITELLNNHGIEVIQI